MFPNLISAIKLAYLRKKLYLCTQFLRAGRKKNKILIHKRPKIMASIQDIQALEQKIYDAVQEYLDYPDGYQKPVLHVFLNDEMEYQAEIEDNLNGTEDDGIYPIESLIYEGEPDNDKASDIANSWIFLD
jgi:hypothetical protein